MTSKSRTWDGWMTQDEASEVLSSPEWQQYKCWSGEYAAVPLDVSDAVLTLMRDKHDVDEENKSAAVRVRLTVEVIGDDE